MTGFCTTRLRGECNSHAKYPFEESEGIKASPVEDSLANMVSSR